MSAACATDKRRFAGVAVASAFAAFLCWPISVVAQDGIAIVHGDCDTGVHLVARGVPMNQLLSRLSEALGFQLRFIGSSESIVDIDIVRRPPELLVKLSPMNSIIVAQAPDPRCPGRDRVTEVWLLSSGAKTPASGQASMTRPAPVNSLPRPLSEEEKQRIRKTQMEDIEK